MRWLGTASIFLSRIGEGISGDFAKLVFFLLSVPFFKGSHLFFKSAYSLNQLRLRHLCGEYFFLQFYNRPIASGDIVGVLNSLRHIKHGLECAEASEQFSYQGRLLVKPPSKTTEAEIAAIIRRPNPDRHPA